MNSYSDTGRSGLIRALLAKGYSFRRAAKLVNAVFDTMVQGLRRGERVEIPGGSIQVAERKAKPRLELHHKFEDLRTGPAFRAVKYRGKRKIVKFRPDEALDLSPLPPSPRPAAKRETLEFRTCRKLVSEMVGEPIDDAGMQLLQGAVGSQARSPISLLEALRERKAKGYAYVTVGLLAADLAYLFTPGPGQGFSQPKDLGPQPPTPEQVEAIRIAAQILEEPVTLEMIKVLQSAADFPWHKAGSLLRRLRTVRDRGWECDSVDQLAVEIQFHYWL